MYLLEPSWVGRMFHELARPMAGSTLPGTWKSLRIHLVLNPINKSTMWVVSKWSTGTLVYEMFLIVFAVVT